MKQRARSARALNALRRVHFIVSGVRAHTATDHARNSTASLAGGRILARPEQGRGANGALSPIVSVAGGCIGTITGDAHSRA
jgi:hypothetical protein